MVTLKEKEAVEYLRKAQSCIKPEDKFPPLQLLSRMLDIEASFLEKLYTSGSNKLAYVTTDATGFPEIRSWAVDIGSALGSYQHLRAERAKTMLHLFQPYMNASKTDVLETALMISRNIAVDKNISRAVAGLTDQQIEYLVKLKEHSMDKLPFYPDRDFPGLLFINNTKTPFLLEKFANHVPNILSRPATLRYGIKFVGGSAGLIGKRLPAILFTSISSDGKIGVVDLKPDRDEDGYYISTEPGDCIIHHEREFYVVFNKKNGDLYFGKEGSERLRNLHPALCKAYISIDLASLTPAQSLEVSKALVSMNEFISSVTDFLEDCSVGTKIDQEAGFFFRKNEELALKMENIFNSLSTDELRAVFQLALAETVGNAKKEVERLAGQNNTALVIKRRWFKPW